VVVVHGGGGRLVIMKHRGQGDCTVRMVVSMAVSAVQ
jgi:hypothetical protein